VDPIDLIHDLIFDHTLRTVALGSATLGIISGALGAYALLRKQSLLGDAMSHAALPGIVLAFLITRSKAPLVLIIGALVAAFVGTLLMMSITRTTRIKEDSALGLILSVFFGFGLMLLTFVQRLPDSSQAGLDKFLFGQAAALLERDVLTMAGLGAVALLIMALFWKEFKLLSFDRDFGTSIGFPMRALDVLMTTLLVIAVVIGLQAVGVVLMSAMIVAPAAAARQWTDRLGVMVALAALCGALAGVIGAVLSSTTTGLSTGPTIVLVAGVIVVVSLLFAPNRGLVWNWVRSYRNRHELRVEIVLSSLYALAVQHNDLEHGHSIAALRAMNVGRGGVARTLHELGVRGWAVRLDSDRWALTSTGLSEARRLAQARWGN
jgi:manganese/zinc/iron transport system permease protein